MGLWSKITGAEDTKLQYYPDQSEEDTNLAKRIQGWQREVLLYYGKEFLNECLLDLEFSLGKQWDEKMKNRVEDNLKVPAFTYNEIGSGIRWLVGYQTMNRHSLNVVGVETDDDFPAAVMATSVKHIMNKNDGDHVLTSMFRDGVNTCWGFTEIYIDYSEDPIRGEVGMERILYDEGFPDPFFRKYSRKDERYFLIRRRKDKESIKEMFPNVPEEKIDWACEHYHELRMVDLDGDKEPEKVEEKWGSIASKDSTIDDLAIMSGEACKTYELWTAWFYDKTPAWIIIDPEGQMVSEKMLEQPTDLAPGYTTISTKQTLPYFAVMLGTTIIQTKTVSPLYPKSKEISVVGYFAYLEPGAKEAKLKHKGLVRDARDPQKGVNLRYTQAAHLMSSSSNSPWIMDYDAFDDHKDPKKAKAFHKKYASSPNYTAYIRHGARADRLSPHVSGQGQLAQAHQDRDEIKTIMSINPSLLSIEDRKDVSGRAMMVRERQGTISGAQFLDNLRWTQKIMGEMIIAAIMKTWTAEKLVRVCGRTMFVNQITERMGKGKPYSFTEGYEQADDKQMEKMVIQLAQEILDNCEMIKYDVEVSPVPESDIQRQIYWEMLMEMSKMGIVPGQIAGPQLLEDSGHPAGKKMAQTMRDMIDKEERAAAAPPGAPGNKEIPAPAA